MKRPSPSTWTAILRAFKEGDTVSDIKYRLALCQIETLPEKTDTMDKAERMVREAA